MWIIPTISRPKQCAELLANLTKLDTSSRGLIFVNGSSHAEEYEKIYDLPDNWEFYYHPENIGALGALNLIFKLWPKEPFYGFIGDDETVHTEGWDSALIKAAGNWNISHANDMWQSHKRIHSHVCIGGDLARSVGYLAIPECWHWFGFDNMWEHIADSFNLRRWCAGVRARHKHHLAGEAFKDECYAIGESKVQEDLESFRRWKRDVAPSVIAKLKEDMIKL